MNYLTIDGTLVADDTRDVYITARSIFIRAGNVTAGSPTTPFQHKFTIQINNTKEDNGWYIDPLIAGNKFIIITGSLNLYGASPKTVQTSLTQSAIAQST
jgi:G8 domain